METFFAAAAPAIQATRLEEGVARTTGVEEEAAIKGDSLTGTSPTRRTAGKSSSRTTKKLTVILGTELPVVTSVLLDKKYLPDLMNSPIISNLTKWA